MRKDSADWIFPVVMASVKAQNAGAAKRIRDQEQPPPIPNDRPFIADLVIADMEKRKQLGISRYGTALQAHNGRNSLQDLYEELLDACVYIRQKIEEENDRLAGV